MAVKPNHARAYRNVPGLLRGFREQSGLTQRELADRLGRPQWWVHRAETGSRRVDVAEFVEWCGGCGVDPHAALDEVAGWVTPNKPGKSAKRGSKRRTARSQ